MKHVLKVILIAIPAILCIIVSFLIGAAVYVWTFSESEYHKGIKWLNTRINWVRILGYILVMGIFLTSCASKSSKEIPVKTTEASVKETRKLTIQVMHFDGYVENIEDEVRFRPRINDTIVILDSWYKFSDSTYISSRRIYGRYIPGALEDWYTDSSYVDYTPAVVIKEFIP